MVNSFSKYYAITGWRLGWLLVPKELQRAVDCLTGNFTICPPTLAQVAAVAAFTPESTAEADALLDHYASNRTRCWTDYGESASTNSRRPMARSTLCRCVSSDHGHVVVLLEATWPTPGLRSHPHRLRHCARRIVRTSVLRGTVESISRRRCAASGRLLTTGLRQTLARGHALTWCSRSMPHRPRTGPPTTGTGPPPNRAPLSSSCMASASTPASTTGYGFALNAAGIDLWAVDQFGHGLSPAPAATSAPSPQFRARRYTDRARRGGTRGSADRTGPFIRLGGDPVPAAGSARPLPRR